MSNINRDEEKKLDKMIEYMDKGDISIPEELDSRVDKIILGLNKKWSCLKISAVVAGAIMLVFFGIVNLVPSLSTYASEIPGLNTVIEWLKIDIGIQNAKEHGYNNLGPVTVSKDGYTLRLDDIYFDDTRIRFSSKLTSEEIYENRLPEHMEIEINIDDKIDDIENAHMPKTYVPDPDSISYILIFNDFDDRSFFHSTSYQSGNTHGVLAKEQIMGITDRNKVRELAENNLGYLNLSAEIYKGRELVVTINDINIPFDSDDILFSKEYLFDGQFTCKYGTVEIGKLTVSPTRMYLETEYTNNGQKYISSLVNIRLKDEKGNQYKYAGGKGLPDKSSWIHEFIPSFYFENMPEELYLCFDRIRVETNENKIITLSLNDVYPKTFEYMGDEIVIEDIMWYENGILSIEANLPNPDNYSIMKIQPINRGGSTEGHYQIENKGANRISSVVIYGEMPEQQQYQVGIAYLGYYLPIEGRIKLKLR